MSRTTFPCEPMEALAPLLRRGKLSPVDLMQATLARVERLDGDLQSFVRLAPDALDQARAAEAEIAAGRYRGPLHGVPIAVKDNYLTADMPTSGRDRRAERSSRRATPPSWRDCGRPARSCSARPACTSSPGAMSPRRPAIPGSTAACRADRAAARGRPSQRASAPSPSGPTPAAPSASRRACAAWSASSRPSGG